MTRKPKRPIKELIAQLDDASDKNLITQYWHCKPHIFFSFNDVTTNFARLKMIVYVYENFDSVLLARLLYDNKSMIIQYE